MLSLSPALYIAPPPVAPVWLFEKLEEDTVNEFVLRIAPA